MSALVLFLALLLALSSAHKLWDLQRLVPVAARLAGVSLPLATPSLLVMAALELLLAIGLLLAPPVRIAAAFGAVLLWLGYAALLLRRKGQRMDCGCDFTVQEKEIDTITIARPALLAALAVSVLFAPEFAWTIDTPFAAVALLALWFASSELAAIPAKVRTRP